MARKKTLVKKERKVEVPAGSSEISDSLFAFFLTGIFIVVLSVVITNHEMWRDELEAWMIARGSTSVPDLFKNIHFQGHPATWHLLLFGVSRFTRDPGAMQMLHVVLATTGVFLFVRYSTFSRLHKALFALSYYPLYEYGVISRHYVLGLLTLIAFCVLYQNRERRVLPMSGVLFLMANTSVFGLLFAGLLGSFLFISYFYDSKYGDRWNVSRKVVIAGILIAVIGMGLSVFQMLPMFGNKSAQMGNPFSAEWVVSSVGTLGASSFLFPDIFNQYYYPLKPANVAFVHMILSILLLVYGGLLFARKRMVFVLFVSGTVIMILFRCFVLYSVSMRHIGHLFLLLLACLWLSDFRAERDLKSPKIERVVSWVSRYRYAFVTLILTVQLAGGIVAGARDVRQVYSAALATSRTIEKYGFQDMYIAGQLDYCVSSVSAYLDRPVFYLGTQRYGTFMIWKPGIKDWYKKDDFDKALNELMKDRDEDVLLVLSPKQGEGFAKSDNYTMTWFWSSPGKNIADESYSLYILKPR